jgi:hypothetical protein
MKYDYRTSAEHWGQAVLSNDRIRFNFKELEKVEFTDMLNLSLVAKFTIVANMEIHYNNYHSFLYLKSIELVKTFIEYLLLSNYLFMIK